MKKQPFLIISLFLLFLAIGLLIFQLSKAPKEVEAVVGTLNLNAQTSSSLNTPGGIWNSSGNVGIGTTGPTGKLDINASSEDALVFTQADGVNRRIFFKETSDQYGGIIRYDATSNFFQLTTKDNGTENPGITILRTGGSVGIGTTAPGYKLDVAGTGNFTGTITAPTFSGALSGNATTATNVAWSGVTSKPSGWLNDANLITGTGGNFNNSLPSGFYQDYNALNSPSATWYNMINVRHSNPANDHGFQIAASYYDENIWTRTYQGGTGANNGTFTPWNKIISTNSVNPNICTLVAYTDISGITYCPAGFYVWSANAATTGQMLCCKVSNPI